jgi:flagellin
VFSQLNWRIKMASTINSNINSLTAQRNLGTSQNSLATSIQRLSSGLRINSSKDDAAGLAISERFTSQIKGVDQAVRNANDGISLAQTAEGAMKAVGDTLQRVRELAVQSANASNSASDRQAIQQEVSQLVSELDRIAQTAQFNGQNVLDGTFGTQKFQVGANANQTITASSANLRTSAYGNNQIKASGGGTITTAVWGSNNTTAGTVAINGSLGSATITIAVNSTALANAALINAQKASTGVSATAVTDLSLTFGTSGAYALTLQSDNTTTQAVSFSLSTVGTAGGLSAAVSAINDQSSKTGVTASLNTAGDKVVLTNASGNDITVSDTTVANAGTVTVQKLDAAGTAVAGTAVLLADITGQSATTVGYITLDSEKSFATDVASSNAFGDTASTLVKVSTLDVTTFANATDAIKTVDSALSYVSGERAKLGALQSRFETTVSTLQVTSESASAARSRILDADFAQETSNLSRAQILQQAGTAMVAQANQLPQGVLALLR